MFTLPGARRKLTRLPHTSASSLRVSTVSAPCALEAAFDIYRARTTFQQSTMFSASKTGPRPTKVQYVYVSKNNRHFTVTFVVDAPPLLPSPRCVLFTESKDGSCDDRPRRVWRRNIGRVRRHALRRPRSFHPHDVGRPGHHSRQQQHRKVGADTK